MNFFNFVPPKKTYPFKIKHSTKSNSSEFDKSAIVSTKLNENFDTMKKLTHSETCSDIVFRKFIININKQDYSAFIAFYDGMSDSNLIDEFILRPLMSSNEFNNQNIKDCIVNYILEQNQVKEINTWKKVLGSLVVGNCLIFVDTLNIVFDCDTKKLPTRSINKSENEMSLNGPSEAFVESLRPNTALIRKFVKDENLIFEDIPIGKCGKTTCSIAYISNITNDSLIEEVRRRVSSIDVDYLIDSGQLVQFIEDKTYITEPLILTTERPDRVALHLCEGRVAILVSGSPNALIVPAVLDDFMHTNEDNYVRYPYASFLRIFRWPALMLSILLPGIYIAVVTFHQEMIPTDLLFAIASAREQVPLPMLLELLLMEIAFEIIREASIRTPSPMGQTLGIVGTLILGQAIVSANVVSPILIIIVAMTGISSFAVANFSLSYSFRILRFLYIILGAFGGFFAISIGMFIHLTMLSVTTSFSIPYFAPITPLGKDINRNGLSNAPIWKQEYRAEFLRVKRTRKEPKLSRRWIKNKSK